MESPMAVAAFASVLGPTVKLAEKGFEIRAVDEQAKGLLQTVQQVAGQLDDARLLQRQKSSRFTDFEKRMFDDTFRHCEDAIRHVASLAERPRADMEVSGGRIKMNTRLVFVLRNSPSINVSLTQLGIASQSLNATIVQLNGRDAMPSTSAGSLPSQAPGQGEWKPPPTYDESQFLSSGRRRNMQRRANAMAFGNAGQPGQPVQHVLPDRSRTLSASTLHIPTVPNIAELVGDESFPDTSQNPLPIIRVANAPIPPSDPIVIETEPIVSTPPRSPTTLSQSTTSPPRSPRVPGRVSSISSTSYSDPGQASSTFSPPQSAGVRTPPNSWAPQFQEPRPPPANLGPQHPVVMPAPQTHHFSYPPYPDSRSHHITIPHPPPQNTAPGISPSNSWTPQQFQDYRPPTGHLAPNPALGIRTSMESLPSNSGLESSSGFAPYSADFTVEPETPAEQKYVYTPSLARRGQGGRHRSHSWLDARAQS